MIIAANGFTPQSLKDFFKWTPHNTNRSSTDMAHSLLAYLLIAIATLQVAFATVYYCDPPKGISYGSYKPVQSKYRLGDRVYFKCDDDYGLYGSSWAKCIYSKTYKRAIWSHKPPVCRRKLSHSNHMIC